MHLRRALLLFAIVLGMAALVASLSQPVDERRDDTAPQDAGEPAPSVANPAPAPEGSATLSFNASDNQSMMLRAGRAATVEVSVAEPGEIEIPELGLVDSANPLTPARFDVLEARPGTYELTFAPAAGGPNEPAGKLVVTSAG
jgi:hypothetical protein